MLKVTVIACIAETEISCSWSPFQKTKTTRTHFYHSKFVEQGTFTKFWYLFLLLFSSWVSPGKVRHDKWNFLLDLGIRDCRHHPGQLQVYTFFWKPTSTSKPVILTFMSIHVPMKLSRGLGDEHENEIVLGRAVVKHIPNLRFFSMQRSTHWRRFRLDHKFRPKHQRRTVFTEEGERECGKNGNDTRNRCPRNSSVAAKQP